MLYAETMDAVRGARLVAHEVAAVRGNRRVLDHMSFVIEPGELVAVVGPSGGGKSTLLESIAGIRAVSAGSVRLDGADIRDESDRVRSQVGFVPQDDIIHRELPLRDTLRYAARLRLPRGTDHDDVVSTVLADLDLDQQASVPVGSLSGGQRKRASIAVELLARPRLLVLDEPTAGLDPVTAAALMRTLRTLTDGGCTVVLSTHNMQDLASADAVTVLAKDGRLVYWGDQDGALRHLGLPSVAPLPPAGVSSPAESPFAHHLDVRPTTGFEQWRVLTRRNAALLTHNPLTIAIMLGAPALVIAMFAVLFTPGAFDVAVASNQPVMVAYWLAFAGFFFGLTYGLLQICTEVPIARREHFAGVRTGPYLASKVTVLVPILFAVDIVMLVVLRGLDRLPSMSTSTFASLAAAILLDAVVAVLMGLLISALVTDVSHATIALPMVCFPAVLFAGAIQAVADMAGVGRAISIVTPARWAFESVGDVLGLAAEPAGAGRTAFDGSLAIGTAALIVFAFTFAFATLATLRRRLA
jgi:ABC-type multidrug transport system ATPase subunit